MITPENKAVRPGWVYFIYAPLLHRCKIGWTSKTPAERLASQTDSPDTLNIWGMLLGLPDLEATIHRHFRHLRVKGEWFAVDDEMRDFVQRHTYHEESAAPIADWTEKHWKMWDDIVANDTSKDAIQHLFRGCQTDPVELCKRYPDPLSYFYQIIKPGVEDLVGWSPSHPHPDGHFMRTSFAYDVLYEMCVSLLPV